ncbi:hypothetical protein [Paenirhodobacter sp.]
MERIAIVWIRHHYMSGRLGRTIVQVVIGGVIVFMIGVWLGHLGAG